MLYYEHCQSLEPPRILYCIVLYCVVLYCMYTGGYIIVSVRMAYNGRGGVYRYERVCVCVDSDNDG